MGALRGTVRIYIGRLQNFCCWFRAGFIMTVAIAKYQSREASMIKFTRLPDLRMLCSFKRKLP